MIVTQLIELLAAAQQAVSTGQSDDSRFKDDLSIDGIFASTMSGLQTYLSSPSLSNVTEADRTQMAAACASLVNAIEARDGFSA